MVGRAGRRPPLLLVVGVVIIGLSVLAMHQLAVDHTLALPATSHAWHAADHAALPAGAPHALPAGSAHPALAVVFDEDSCSAGCSTDDDMSVAACLLALTLLAFCQRLTPPRPHPLPAAALPRSPAPLPLALDRRAALSLAELSIRRT